MLADEITAAQRFVRTDAYQMSIGEIVSMYDEEEIIIDPEFQRLFRWDSSQKSRLVESLLLGIPLPSIFVFERETGKWELIDGLQRVSTILEFMGKLRSPTGGVHPPSVMEATRYLPSLHNAVWEASEGIEEVALREQAPIDKVQQLAIRRARIGVSERCKLVDEILSSGDKRFSKPNDDLINTRSNLNFATFSDICVVCDVDPSPFADKETFIDVVLLKRRNGIAHGEDPFVAASDLDDLVAETVGLMRSFGDALENIVYLKQYRSA